MKSQSAMEYLMTYGWAVLIVGIVLVVLFDLGAFSAPAFTSTCIAQSGFLCTNPIITNTGAVYVQFAQNIGSPINITGFGCSNSSIAPTYFNATYIVLQPGEQIDAMFPCTFSSSSAGSHFSGTLWLEYSVPSASHGLEEQIGTIYGDVAAGQIFYFITYNNYIYAVSTLTNKISAVAQMPNSYTALGVLASNNGYAYVEWEDGSTYGVDVISPSGTIAANVVIPGAISDFAVSQAGNAYVGWNIGQVFGSGTTYGVDIINPSGEIVANTITPGLVYDIAPSTNGHAYLTYEIGTNMYGIDILSSSGGIVANVPLTGFFGDTNIAPNGDALVGIRLTGGEYEDAMINSAGSIVANTPQNSYPIEVSMAPDGTSYFLWGSGSFGGIYIMSPSGAVIANVLFTGQGVPFSALPSTNGNAYVIIGISGEDFVDVLNQSGSIVANTLFDGNIGTAIAAPNGDAYIFYDATNEFYIINQHAQIVSSSPIVTGFPSSTAITPNSELYVGTYQPGIQYGIDAINPQGTLIQITGSLSGSPPQIIPVPLQ